MSTLAPYFANFGLIGFGLVSVGLTLVSQHYANPCNIVYWAPMQGLLTVSECQNLFQQNMSSQSEGAQRLVALMGLVVRLEGVAFLSAGITCFYAAAQQHLSDKRQGLLLAAGISTGIALVELNHMGVLPVALGRNTLFEGSGVDALPSFVAAVSFAMASWFGLYHAFRQAQEQPPSKSTKASQ